MAITRGKIVGGIGAVVIAIIGSVVVTEGGYVNDPRDPGGETNHGVTVNVAREFGYKGPMKDLTKEQAFEIYNENYIKKPGFTGVIEQSHAVGEKLVDAGVNTGPARPSRWFQTALNALNRNQKDYADIQVDGKVGPASIAAYNSLVKVRGKVRACQLIVKLMDAQQAMHYLSLTNLEVYAPGWIDNRIGNVPLSKCNE